MTLAGLILVLDIILKVDLIYVLTVYYVNLKNWDKAPYCAVDEAK